MNYKEAQDYAITKYRIKLNPCSECWGRTHAHVKKRMVCKWKPKNSIQATFELFHEIGHIETYHSGMRRCESEYAATVWAMDLCEEIGLKVPERTLQEYEDYINRERSRGVRRHASDLPTVDELRLRRE